MKNREEEGSKNQAQWGDLPDSVRAVVIQHDMHIRNFLVHRPYDALLRYEEDGVTVDCDGRTFTICKQIVDMEGLNSKEKITEYVLRCLKRSLLLEIGLSHLVAAYVRVVLYRPGRTLGRLRAILRFRNEKERVDHPRISQSLPPKTAQFILYLVIPRKEREPLLGDLREEYETIIRPQLSLRQARIWYWVQVMTSVGPILGRRLAKLASFEWAVKFAISVVRRILT